MYEESSAQTLATGKTIADLPSKSKVKLGRYGDADLQWLVSRNAENKLILVMSTESMTALGSKILDAAEPSNGNSDRQKYGNNRYIYTNLHPVSYTHLDVYKRQVASDEQHSLH